MSQLQFLGYPDQMLFAHQVRPQFGEFTFAKTGKAMEKFFRRHKSQDRISQEFELFVISYTRAAGGFQFPRLGAVGQGLFQQLHALEVISQRDLQDRNVS